MKKKVSKRKGFTLVELLVVIAILAVLITVTVIGFVGFTKKAKDSNDQALAAQINRLFLARETLEGKPNTMHEALKAVEKEGFIVDKLTPTNDENDFLWDQTTNEFVIYDKEGNPVYPKEGEANSDLWKIVHSEEELNEAQERGFSTYLADDYTGPEEVNTELNTVIFLIKNGFDAGNYEGVEGINYKINYENLEGHGDRIIIIRTNSGNMEITGPLDTIHHYNYADELIITEVANESYHEYGTIGCLEIAKGHLVLEEASHVNLVYVSAEEEGSVTMENSGSDVGSVIATNETVQSALAEDLPDLNIDFVEQETMIKRRIGAILFNGGEGTQDKPYIIADKDQLANINGMTYYHYNNDTNEFESLLNLPYNTWEEYREAFDEEVLEADETNYRCEPDLVLDGKDWPTKLHLHGSFDGNGLTVNNLDCAFFSEVTNKLTKVPGVHGRYVPVNDEPVTIKNITVNATIGSKMAACGLIYDCGHKVEIENVTVKGRIMGTTQLAGFVAYGPGQIIPEWWYYNVNDLDLTFRDCICEAELVQYHPDATYVSQFICHPFCDNCNINIIDSAGVGTVRTCKPIGKEINQVKKIPYFIAQNANSSATVTESYSDNFLTKLSDNHEGVTPEDLRGNLPEGSNPAASVEYRPNESWDANNGKKKLINVSPFEPTPSEVGETIKIRKATNAVSARVTLVVTLNGADETGGFPYQYIEDMTLQGENFESQKIKYATEYVINDATENETLPDCEYRFSEDNTCYIHEEGMGKVYNGAHLVVAQFKEDGDVVAVSKHVCSSGNRVKMKEQVDDGESTPPLRKDAAAGRDYEYTFPAGATIEIQKVMDDNDCQILNSGDYTVEGNKVTIHEGVLVKEGVKHYIIKVTLPEPVLIKAKLQDHMASGGEVEVKDNDNNLIGKLKFDGSVPKLTYEKEEGSTADLNSNNFKAAFAPFAPDLADLEGTVEFEYDSDDSTQINKITYKLTFNGKNYTSDIVIADLSAPEE